MTEKLTNEDKQKENDHHANQLNPNSKEYQQEMDNKANQLNPNNEEYHKTNNS